MDNLILKYHEQRLENFLEKISSGKSLSAYKNPVKHLIDLFINVLISRNTDYNNWSKLDLLSFKLNCLNALIHKNTLDPIYEGIEKALRSLENNDPLGSQRTLKEMLKNRDATESAIQKVRGNKPKKPHPLDAFIRGLANKNPQITSSKVMDEIRAIEGGDLIDQVDDQGGHIYFKGDPEPRSLSISTIKDKLARIKNNIINS